MWTGRRTASLFAGVRDAVYGRPGAEPADKKGIAGR